MAKLFQVRSFDNLLSMLAAAVLFLSIGRANAAPEIRSSESNQVPACVTPARLMDFVVTHNEHLAARYARIAELYKYYGEVWRVRWDYAFFQMAIETNYLTYRRGDGRRGDVWEYQNNFAGIGATGHGVRGEKFADIETGVHAQIQHLVAYSGERVEDPIARRTRENQDDIIAKSRRLGRPVTFGDLARRWATDRAYAKSIDFVADLYRTEYCGGDAKQAAEDVEAPVPHPVHRARLYPFRPPSGLGGPQPQGLAGPEPEADASEEVLPWLAEPVRRPTPDAGAAAPKSKPARAPAYPESAHGAKIKTIWSRGDATKTVKHDAPATTAGSPVGATDAMPLNKIAPPPQHASGDPAALLASNGETAANLPTFRIAPIGTEPSRLGGPASAPVDVAPTPVARSNCKIVSVRYGGTKTLLVRSLSGAETRFAALTVLDGFEKSLLQVYAKSQSTTPEVIGEYPNAAAALADARVNCPEGK